MLTQGFRYRQVLTFITVPDETFIERQSRKLVHMRFESTDVQGMMKMKLLSGNTFDPEHPLGKLTRIHRGISEITVKMVKLQLLSHDLGEKYETKKKGYMDTRFREFQEQLEPMDGGNLTVKHGRPALSLKCDECGYEWDYTGYRSTARCPNCEPRIYVSSLDEKEDIGIRIRCSHCETILGFTQVGQNALCAPTESSMSMCGKTGEMSQMNNGMPGGMWRRFPITIYT